LVSLVSREMVAVRTRGIEDIVVEILEEAGAAIEVWDRRSAV